MHLALITLSNKCKEGAPPTACQFLRGAYELLIILIASAADDHTMFPMPSHSLPKTSFGVDLLILRDAYGALDSLERFP